MKISVFKVALLAALAAALSGCGGDSADTTNAATNGVPPSKPVAPAALPNTAPK